MTKKRVFRSHHYPTILQKNPWLILPYYVFAVLFYPRNLRFFFQLRRRILQLRPSVVLEVGFGEGLHLFVFGLLFRKIRFYGYDIRSENVHFVNSLCHFFSLNNVSVMSAEEFRKVSFRNFDIVYFMGVLQYVENDIDFLSTISTYLSPKGNLLIYQPVHYIRYITPLQKIIDKYEHYEKEVGLLRHYNEEDLFYVLQKSHLKITHTKRYVYKPGGTAHEIFSALYIPVVKDSRTMVKVICASGLILVWPVLALLHLADNFYKSGIHNAVCVTTESGGVNKV